MDFRTRAVSARASPTSAPAVVVERIRRYKSPDLRVTHPDYTNYSDNNPVSSQPKNSSFRQSNPSISRRRLSPEDLVLSYHEQKQNSGSGHQHDHHQHPDPTYCEPIHPSFQFQQIDYLNHHPHSQQSRLNAEEEAYRDRSTSSSYHGHNQHQNPYQHQLTSGTTRPASSSWLQPAPASVNSRVVRSSSWADVNCNSSSSGDQYHQSGNLMTQQRTSTSANEVVISVDYQDDQLDAGDDSRQILEQDEACRKIYKAKAQAKTVSSVEGCLYIDYKFAGTLPPGFRV